MHAKPTGPKTQTLRYCKVDFWRTEPRRKLSLYWARVYDRPDCRPPPPPPPGRKRLVVNSPPGFFPPLGPHKPFPRVSFPRLPVSPRVEECFPP